ncbi:MAG: DUF805 domain-containing protein [Asticcacaulis sp.]|uniref:DUF805 domain-containing protein n=1 Tax=Asticcacaulis sp. TaxID=1872648 RepID=UPI0039E44A6B
MQRQFHFWAFFFSLKGRVTRLPFALTVLPFKLFFACVPHVMRAYSLPVSSVTMVLGIITICHLIVLWPLFAVTFKRLHDVGLSGFLALLASVPGILNFIASFIQSRALLDHAYNPTLHWTLMATTIAFYTISACTLALALWPGNKGPNQYGPSPRQPDMDKSDVF